MNPFEFYRDHVIMSLYGTRCTMYGHLDINLDNPLPENADEETKEVVEQLKKLDEVVEKGQSAIREAQAPDVDNFSMQALDEWRRTLKDISEKTGKEIDAIMTTNVMMGRLYKVANKRRQQAEQQQRIHEMKEAVNPANLSGSAKDLQGAETVAITPSESGAVEVKPVN